MSAEAVAVQIDMIPHAGAQGKPHPCSHRCFATNPSPRCPPLEVPPRAVVEAPSPWPSQGAATTDRWPPHLWDTYVRK